MGNKKANDDPFRDEDGEVEELEPITPLKRGGKMGEIFDLLEAGLTREDCVEQGYNSKTVDMVAWQMVKEGLIQKDEKQRGPKKQKQIPEGAGGRKSSEQAPAGNSPLSALVGGKQLSAEGLMNMMDIPTLGVMVPLEKGIEVGMYLVVMGVRMAQELSTIGVTQARPLVAMAKEMRAGETIAAQAASEKTARAIGDDLENYLTPALQTLSQQIEDIEPVQIPAAASSKDPGKAMIAKMFEPMMTQMMGRFMPGMGGVPQSTAQEETGPSGWAITTEIEEEKPNDAVTGAAKKRPRKDRSDNSGVENKQEGEYSEADPDTD